MQVDSDSVWLHDYIAGTAYFPTEEGKFNLEEHGAELELLTLNVEGADTGDNSSIRKHLHTNLLLCIRVESYSWWSYSQQ